MSTSALYRAAVNIARRAPRTTLAAAASSPLAQSAVSTVRKNPRLSVVAASAATVGMLGAAGFAAGPAPFAQALDSAAKTVQSGPQGAPAQIDASVFGAVSGTKAATSGAQLDAANSGTANHKVSGTGALGKQQAAKAAPAKPAAKAAPAKPAAKAAPAKPATPAEPYTIYDSVSPSHLPAGKPAAVYVNGAYATSWSQVSNHNSLLWIDINGSNPGATVLDVEPGDASPKGAAVWAQQRLGEHPNSVAIIYTMKSEWPQVKSWVAHLSSTDQSKIRYWIADPTGVEHIVPGSSATQWYWGSDYDITTAAPNFTQ